MNLLDNLTYTDLGGKRRLRRYVKAALAILAILAFLAPLVLVELKREAQAAAPTPFEWPAAIPTPSTLTHTPAPPAPVIDICPSDPAEWKLLDVYPGDNYKRIAPACVYDGLGRTIAWALAVDMGYSGAAAAQALGFAHLPLAGIAGLDILTNHAGPLRVSLLHRPLHPDYAAWRFDQDQRPFTTFALLGCFRTATMVGNKVEQWGDGYPVICVAARDLLADADYQFLSLGERHFASLEGEPIHRRSFAFFGYEGAGRWVWLGEWRGLGSDDLDPTQAADEYELLTELYGTPIWNAGWLSGTYDLSMRPLPEDWQSYTAEADMQAILDELNVYDK